MPTLYLERANKSLVNHCRCRGFPVIDSSAQMDCPWCGCGWLFPCLDCGKTFAFARGVELDESLEDLAARHFARTRSEEEGPADATDIARWVEWMQVLLKPVQPGQTYVYLDGFYIDADTAPLRFEGFHSRHDLPWVPQLKALEDPTVLHDILANEDYWHQSKLDDPR